MQQEPQDLPISSYQVEEQLQQATTALGAPRISC
jgi:hypothetical protein